ncbi:hypothetical protein FIU95_12525 [Microbulbifer sp. THAF38]|nr:hypothetical protein FIU95_12525 [Microbulbifer sp. THAF38]
MDKNKAEEINIMYFTKTPGFDGFDGFVFSLNAELSCSLLPVHFPK